MIKNNLSWDTFSIPDIFDEIQRGKRFKKSDHVAGKVPYISSTALNNGVDSFVTQIHKNRVFKDCISLANSGSVGKAFYEPFTFVASDHITHLKKSGMSKYGYLYLTTSLEKQKSNFNFNREINDKRIERLKIVLPTDASGNPAYDHMEEYTSTQEKTLLDRYKSFALKNLEETIFSDIPPLEEKKWGHFLIDSLFIVNRPRYRTHHSYQDGEIPFIASGARNNGVVRYCDPKKDEKLDSGNCITVSPVDGSSFYQPVDFLGRGGGGSSMIILRNRRLNKYNGIFIAGAVQKACSQYMYGRMGNSNSIKRKQILLPIDDSQQPDYAYIEQYVKNKMCEKYKKYLDYLESQNR
ncbi:restriction endonuclease subunit S [Rothia sp. ZJ932]|uniref:restriction endonuclease subunit S n=1 Tax=Rothia sp. ZJ932 TaxID=2810516 RepID=UPI0019673422|nr:restriction endonuclease subunit S [Rothia sp. ZJ932]QRZ61715.1 restriction endonuclease subunit S [Rothia sp. ZJ932]